MDSLRKYFVICAAALFCLATLSNARAATRKSSHPTQSGRGVGLGLILGEPSGVTGKFWTSKTNAVDAGLAYSFNSFVLIYGDYLWHFFNALENAPSAKDVAPYVGVGGAFFISSESNRKSESLFTDSGSVGLGLRIPLGLEWTPSSVPIGVFLEIAPGIGFIPSTYGFFQGGIGVRYYFG